MLAGVEDIGYITCAIALLIMLLMIYDDATPLLLHAEMAPRAAAID